MKKIITTVVLTCFMISSFSQKSATISKYKEIASYINYGNIQEVKNFVNSGYSVKPPSDFEFSLLTVAIMYKQLIIAQYLIDSGADVNFENGSGKEKSSVLGYAFNIDNPYDYIKLLLQNGANPNYKEASGLYVIDKAFNTKNNNIILLLLNAGANVNNYTYIENIKYSSLGLLLSLHYDYTAVKMLIEKKADVNSKIYYSSKNITISVLDFAEYINKNSDIVKLLKANGAKNYYNTNSTSSNRYLSLNSIFSYIGTSNTSGASKNYSSSYNPRNNTTLEIIGYYLDKSNFCNGSCDRYIISFNKEVNGPNEWNLNKNQIYVYLKHNGEWHSSSSLTGSYIARNKNKVKDWAINKYK